MASQDNNYFDMFTEMGQFALQSAQTLQNTLQNFDRDTLKSEMDKLHQIEHAADLKKHILLEKLAKEFVPPIEREDILQMAAQLDDVIDGIEDILIKIYMFNIQEILPEGIEFLEIIRRCCAEMMEILKEFPHFKRSKSIHNNIVELNRLEEVGDKLYVQAVHALFKSDLNPIVVQAWTEVFGQMEWCCDACEHTANVVEEVIMKNT